MSLYSQENARKILDRLIERPSIAAATRAILNSNSKILYVWCRNAASDRENGIDDSPYLVRDWPGEGDATWFDKGIKQTRVMHALNLDSDERDTLTHSERYVIEGGKLQWEPDPKVAADAMSLDELDWLAEYGTRDRSDIWKRDESGALIPLKVKQEQPAQMRIFALRAMLENLWNVPERRETDNKHSLTGALVIGARKALPAREPSPLEQDLRARLAAIRANPDRPSAKPTAPVEVIGRGESGPTERVNNGMADDVKPDLRDHPRAYEAPASQPKPEAPLDYRRPTKSLNAEDRGGSMPSGGVSITTGRAT